MRRKVVPGFPEARLSLENVTVSGPGTFVSLPSKTLSLPLRRTRGPPSLFRPPNQGSAAGANFSLRSRGGKCWASARWRLPRTEGSQTRPRFCHRAPGYWRNSSARGASVGQLRVENQPASGRRRAGLVRFGRIRMSPSTSREESPWC